MTRLADCRRRCSRGSRCSSVVVVFFQIGVVSEVPVFGVNIDLSPLLVAFVGLLCGSTLGAADRLRGRPARRPRAGADARRDLADLHADRLLVPGACASCATRRPRSTPLLVGAAAPAAALVGYSLIEFLLGVDAPVSLELLRQIVLGVVLNTVVALPVWAIVRRCLRAACPRIRAAGAGAPTRPAGSSPLSQPA